MFGKQTQRVNCDARDLSLPERERVKIKDPRIKKLYDGLSRASQKAYRDDYLLSSCIFAKSDLSVSALESYLEGREAEAVSISFCLKKLFRYFVKSFGWLVVFCGQGLGHRFSLQKFIPDPERPLTLIDIYLTPEKIAKTGDLTDRFFPGLEDRLKSKGMSYAYTPRLIGPGSPGLYYRTFRFLKEKNRPVLSSFQLLGLCDYLKMLAFIPVYPLRVLRQVGQLGSSAEDRILNFFLWDTMDHVAVKNYARQLFGRRISEMDVPLVKCISWYENQSQDKNFYKGLRSIPGKVWICGAQLYLWPETLLNLHADENEMEYGLTPDRILVNGTYYLREESALDFETGPSMRYAQLFETEVDARGKSALLVLMPFFEFEINKILEMLDQSGLSAEILVKFHPATERKKYEKHIDGKMQIVEDDLYALFDRIGCVVGKSTGALIEAACLGIPVINIETKSGLRYDYMPRFGKGVIWENVSSGPEIASAVKRLQKILRNDVEKIRSIGSSYEKMFFCRPTSEKIDTAFELNK